MSKKFITQSYGFISNNELKVVDETFNFNLEELKKKYSKVKVFKRGTEEYNLSEVTVEVTQYNLGMVVLPNSEIAYQLSYIISVYGDTLEEKK